MVDERERRDDAGNRTARRMNVVQLLVLSVLFGATAGLGAGLGGAGWGFAALLSWGTTLFMAFAITAVLFAVDEWGRQRRREDDEGLDVLIDAWDRDLARDQRAAASRDAQMHETQNAPQEAGKRRA